MGLSDSSVYELSVCKKIKQMPRLFFLGQIWRESGGHNSWDGDKGAEADAVIHSSDSSNLCFYSAESSSIQLQQSNCFLTDC